MISYQWTHHARYKMAFYKLSESRVRRVIKTPMRTEEGIATDTIAVMQPSSFKGSGKSRTWNREIWVMYQLKRQNRSKQNIHKKPLSPSLVVISAWRYPGKTSPREALPDEIMNEVREATVGLIDDRHTGA